ncbi:RNA methyltransferase [Streptomyces sp. NP160]|uniref:TrmH family RNA methyltransferase n=1 Tax=Streptomyces sp. NP160 TaxID=2586637 RepID=UPI00111B93B2|nr:RNA methyltransferase [Streptomyces sp. NP160]TNM68211.1 RNA methyltransferase [Streptomyces sp. NP160]
MIHLDSPDDPRLTDYTGLTDVALRRVREPAEGLFIAESSQVIRRALRAGHRPRSLLTAPRWLPDLTDVLSACEDAGAEVFVAEEPVLEAITGFHVHRGAIASMHRPAMVPVADLLRGARTVVVLEDVVDHTNTGAVFRSAAGLGVDAVLVTPRCADPLYRRSVRVSMGTVFQVPWTRIEPWPAGITQLQQAGFHVAALALTDDSVPLQDFAATRPEKLALLLGTEGAGLTPASVAAADTVVRIPMHGGVDSLNVAAASAVAFWAVGEDATTARPAQLGSAGSAPGARAR